MTKKKHEELAEEVRLLWCEECADGPLRHEYRPDLDNICEIGAEEVCGERARKVIAYIFSAVRNGLSIDLVEEIAALEHEQWITWSRAVAEEVGDERRERWERYWVPYEELSEEVKEHDRIWARKIIALTGTGKEGTESARVYHPDTAKET